jgi:carbon-monoxide dehydrogenase small subunit
MDGKAVNACLVLALQAESKALQTIEGLGSPERLHPLQESFIRNDAVQCGFCKAGMLMSAAVLLEEHPHPNTREIKRAISDNFCRCTGYVKIIKAVQDAAA